MRTLFAAAFAAFALLVAHGAPAAAQGYTPPNQAEQREAMARLAPLIGRWAGQANVLSPQEALVHQTELVEPAMDGLLLVIRGTGYATPAHTGAPVFEALAVISYDDARDIYEFRAYAHGHASTATGQFLEDGAFRWSIAPGGPVRIQYTIRFSGESWSEIGEMSYDNGQTWTRTIEMNLTRAR
ncbi:MAG TPA: hypothetical protein PLN53_00300 [Terricaulis sp.]|nr:hypothetical protein [Terricaulis sp.]